MASNAKIATVRGNFIIVVSLFRGKHSFYVVICGGDLLHVLRPANGLDNGRVRGFVGADVGFLLQDVAELVHARQQALL